jgi:hypothetical protein
MRNYKDMKPPLPIRNFVLAEATLNFCNLAIDVFKFAEPRPEKLSLELTLEDMTENGVPCTLSSAPDNGPHYHRWKGNTRSAPSDPISSAYLLDFASADAEIAAFQLVGGLYLKFGFNLDEVPYKHRGADAEDRISTDTLFVRPQQ